MNILVFGATGMLGSMVYSYFKKSTKFSVHGTYYNESEIGPFDKQELEKFDASNQMIEQFDSIFNKFRPDYIINCIGIINRYCNTGKRKDVLNAVNVNAIFPSILSEYCEESGNTKIIQIATDCVYDGEKGGYIESDSHNPEDVYGKTKSLGEIIADNFLNIRCSIIGPEINNFNSLFEWFISQKPNSTVSGYNHHSWNGVTTLQFAQYCEDIIEKNIFGIIRKNTPVIHFTPNETVTKYRLLTIFSKVFCKKCVIRKIDNIGKPIKRDLDSEVLPIKVKTRMEEAILNLKIYLENNDIYNTERYFK